MKFDGFTLTAIPHIIDATCRGCGGSLHQVSNGWFSAAFFCPQCENVYQLKLIKAEASKVSKAFLMQARTEVERAKGGDAT